MEAQCVIHIIVLVHGWLGNALEMDSIKASLSNAVEEMAVSSTPQANDDKTQNNKNQKLEHRFVIHSAICNEGKTNDGIAAGGSRLAEEINSLVEYIAKENNSQNHPRPEMTLSICGNSLGGLYARRALADIRWDIPLDQGQDTLIAGNENDNTVGNGGDTDNSLHPNRSLIPMLFVTTATPHLGVSQHTYIPLPRAVEYPIARILDQTGQDLFRFSSVMEELTFDPRFLAPLRRFQQRIAYANVFGTDFQVPTPTAAFWALDSDSPHLVETWDDHELEDDPASQDEPLKVPNKLSPPSTIVMALSTPQVDVDDDDDDDDDNDGKSQRRQSLENQDPSTMFREWSRQLDSLGWTKVLVDVREHVPSVSVWSSSSSSSISGSDSETTTVETKPKINNKYSKYSTKTKWTADELLREFGAGLLAASTVGLFSPPPLRIPLGHTVMIANAKDSLNRWLTSGGKPVMDWLSLSMIQTLQKITPKVLNKTTGES